MEESIAAAIEERLTGGWFSAWQFPVEVGNLCYIVRVELHESYESEAKNRRKDGTYRAKNRKAAHPDAH